MFGVLLGVLEVYTLLHIMMPNFCGQAAVKRAFEQGRTHFFMVAPCPLVSIRTRKQTQRRARFEFE